MCAPYLQDTFAAVHDGYFVLTHELYAALSSDEFNFSCILFDAMA